jgi:hypothetical protein
MSNQFDDDHDDDDDIEDMKAIRQKRLNNKNRRDKRKNFEEEPRIKPMRQNRPRTRIVWDPDYDEDDYDEYM